LGETPALAVPAKDAKAEMPGREMQSERGGRRQAAGGERRQYWRCGMKRLAAILFSATAASASDLPRCVNYNTFAPGHNQCVVYPGEIPAEPGIELFSFDGITGEKDATFYYALEFTWKNGPTSKPPHKICDMRDAAIVVDGKSLGEFSHPSPSEWTLALRERPTDVAHVAWTMIPCD
jgi:hypothetical protein